MNVGSEKSVLHGLAQPQMHQGGVAQGVASPPFSGSQWVGQDQVASSPMPPGPQQLTRTC